MQSPDARGSAHVRFAGYSHQATNTGEPVNENNDVRTDDTTQPQWSSAPVGHTASPVTVGAQPPVGMQQHGFVPQGPVGEVRSTGTCIALCIVTFGIYSLVWFYKTHEEMKRHTNSGLGGGLALVLGLFVSFVMWFITPSEIAGMYERRGMRSPVSGATGLWALLLGWCFGLGLVIWFVKVNGALNAYWRSQGVR
jgi:hypothetical protein